MSCRARQIYLSAEEMGKSDADERGEQNETSVVGGADRKRWLRYYGMSPESAVSDWDLIRFDGPSAPGDIHSFADVRQVHGGWRVSSWKRTGAGGAASKLDHHHTSYKVLAYLELCKPLAPPLVYLLPGDLTKRARRAARPVETGK